MTSSHSFRGQATRGEATLRWAVDSKEKRRRKARKDAMRPTGSSQTGIGPGSERNSPPASDVRPLRTPNSQHPKPKEARSEFGAECWALGGAFDFRKSSAVCSVITLGAGLVGANASMAESVEWTRRGTGPIALLDIRYGDGLWMARGGNEGSPGFLYISTDLNSWERVLYPVDPATGNWVELTDFAHGAGLWIAVGSGGFTAASPDGRTWTINDPAYPTGDLRRILHANGAWVALADGDEGGMWTSADGRSWTFRQLSAGGPPWGLAHAAYGSGTWLVPEVYTHPSLGPRLRLWHSTDARTWTFSEPELPLFDDGNAGEITALEYANGLWLMARHAADADLWASSDGRHWTAVFNGGQVDDLCYADGAWVAKSGQSVLMSTDARSWHTHHLAASWLHEIYFAAGTLVASGKEVTPSSVSNCLYVARTPEPWSATMDIQRTPDGSGFEVSCRGPRDHAYRLQRSADLQSWTDIAVAHRRLAAYPVSGSLAREFFRTVVQPQTTDDDWKNQIAAAGTVEAAGEPFLSVASAERPGEQPRWIKFALPLEEPGRVYFQDSSKYVFHYEFARARIPRFAGMSVEEFEAVSLFRQRQQIVLGALMFPPNPLVAEIGIQLVGADVYPPERVAEWFQCVRSRVVIPGVTFYYLPVFEQAANVADDAAELAARGVPVGSLDRWVDGDQCYSRGWALGRLVYVPPADIPAAYADGRLRTSDILLTDAVPAEIPPVAGLLTLSPAAPNSHVVILAQSNEVPVGCVVDPALRTQVLGWKGEEVLLQVYPAVRGGVVKALKAGEHLSADLRQRLLALKQPSSLDVVPKTSAGRIALPVADLAPADLRYVGGKAANFGVLARAIPENAPAGAIAFTFDLWDGFLNREIEPGTTLGKVITEKLEAFTGVPADLVALQQALAAVRRTITQAADFSADQKRAILEALSGFDSRRNLRFRSSTNVEDGEAFTGAGLYDSHSGCLADDLDGDDRGPSHCDPTENDERGVFRALRKVYASFYNDNAFLERRRRGVREEDVGMGILVHVSAPDEIEWANGVATLRVTQAQDPATRAVSAKLVTQAGAVSVANPEEQAKPEIVTAEWSGRENPAWTVEQPSGLVRLGDRVLEWPTDYETLLGLLDQAARAYAALFPDKPELMLDFEYKKLDPGHLSVKQIREIPRPSRTAPLLIPDAGEIVVLQYSTGLGSDIDLQVRNVWGNHRLKSSWRFLPSPLDLGLVAEVTLRDGDAIQTVTGPMGQLPEASVVSHGSRVHYAFVRGEGASRRTIRLNLEFPWDVEHAPPPFAFLSDAVMDLEADYATPQPFGDWAGALSSRTHDQALLEPKEKMQRGAQPVILSLKAAPLTIESEYDYWQWFRSFYRGDYLTAAVAGFRETRLIGLASRPIVLRSDFAQTYFTVHHSWGQWFLFEPGIEPGIDPQILTELRAANIKAVGVYVGRMGSDGGQIACQGCDEIMGRPSPMPVCSRVSVLGHDGTWRAW